MKKIVKLFIVFFAFLAVVTPSFSAFAEDSGYYIKNYDVHIKVGEDNCFFITENIDVYFNESRHGIYRYIPVNNNVQRADGTESEITAKIKNVKVSEQYESYYNDYDEYTLQIGDADKTVKGDHSYEISYSYNLGKDMCAGYDELYYNIIGTGWDTHIENVSFSIEMPKEFDANELGFSTGVYTTVGTDSINYSVDGSTINGTVPMGLDEHEALTVRLTLPDGYFKFNAAAYYLRNALIILIPVIALACVLIIWSKYGRDKKVIDVVEFYPPENMNCAEMSFWFKGSITTEDTIALMIELANEGYIEINPVEKRFGIIKRQDFEIVKIKEYNGNDYNKKIFFNGLFEKKNVVTENDLENKFYVHADKIVRNIASAENYHKIFDKKSTVMTIVGIVISVFAGFISYLVYQSSFSRLNEFICLAVGIIICVISFIMSFFIRRRTEQGHELKQKINGFKIFLETAEKERLEEMVNENPTYYYDILPYAYVLGVSDKWTKNFEGIVVEPPKWYCGNAYDTFILYSFINSTMSSATSAMTSSPQSSSSSSIGGGGFSGGGSGGGGGGSW